MSGPGGKRKVDDSTVRDLLRGAYDMHVHSAPDVVPRKVDDVQLATMARDNGMGGLVVKCHNAATVGRAYVLQQFFPELRIFGGIVMNNSVGGVNPEAARIALGMGAKVVWLPTVSAQNHIDASAHSEFMASIGGGSSWPGLVLVDDDGKLKPEVIEVMRLVKDAGAILHTGHVSLREIRPVVAEAHKMGLERMVVTHPEFHVVNMSIAEQKELTDKYGCYFERDFVSSMSPAGPCQFSEIGEAVRVVGAARSIMGTDFGQARNDYPVEGMRLYIRTMLEYGISEKDVETMVQKNPAELLGVSAAASPRPVAQG